MKTNCQNLAWGGLRYESPSLETIELATEGAFAASNDVPDPTDAGEWIL